MKITGNADAVKLTTRWHYITCCLGYVCVAAVLCTMLVVCNS